MLERLNTSSSLPFTYLGRDSIGVPGRQSIQDLLNVPFSLGSERFAWRSQRKGSESAYNPPGFDNGRVRVSRRSQVMSHKWYTLLSGVFAIISVLRP